MYFSRIRSNTSKIVIIPDISRNTLNTMAQIFSHGEQKEKHNAMKPEMIAAAHNTNTALCHSTIEITY